MRFPIATLYSPTYTSPRPASSTAVTMLLAVPCVTASASSMETVASGFWSTSHSPFTVANPTRKPVNEPGPETTAKPSRSVVLRRFSCSKPSIVGISRAE